MSKDPPPKIPVVSMKRALSLTLFALASCCFVSFINPTPDTVAPGKPAVRTLIIDPGHGGDFAGAQGLFSNEKQVSLEVALKLGKAFQKEFPEIKVVYTRTSDANAGNKKTLNEDLRYRADLANSSGGDLFISIHCNAAGKRPGGWYEKVVVGKTAKTRMVGKGKKKKKQTYYEYQYQNVWRENTAKGTETYVWAVNKNDAKISSVAKNNEYYGEMDSVSGLKLPDPSDPAEMARMLVYAQNYFKKSLTLADFVEKEFAASGRTSRGVRQRNDTGIWVLQATGMPSILVEIGFISNKEEEEYLNSEKGQDEIVRNIINAFKSYKEKLEAKGPKKAF
jgi:N-acetylmuramoyl-L-alanine amidase